MRASCVYAGRAPVRQVGPMQQVGQLQAEAAGAAGWADAGCWGRCGRGATMRASGAGKCRGNRGWQGVQAWADADKRIICKMRKKLIILKIA